MLATTAVPSERGLPPPYPRRRQQPIVLTMDTEKTVRGYIDRIIPLSITAIQTETQAELVMALSRHMAGLIVQLPYDALELAILDLRDYAVEAKAACDAVFDEAARGKPVQDLLALATSAAAAAAVINRARVK